MPGSFDQQIIMQVIFTHIDAHRQCGRTAYTTQLGINLDQAALDQCRSVFRYQVLLNVQNHITVTGRNLIEIQIIAHLRNINIAAGRGGIQYTSLHIDPQREALLADADGGAQGKGVAGQGYVFRLNRDRATICCQRGCAGGVIDVGPDDNARV